MWYPPLIHSVEKSNKVFKSYIFLMHTEHKRITESEQFVNFTQRQTDLKVKKESCEMSTDTMGYKLLWNQSHQQSSNQFSKLILTNQNVLGVRDWFQDSIFKSKVQLSILTCRMVWFFDICNESQKETVYRINKLSNPLLFDIFLEIIRIIIFFPMRLWDLFDPVEHVCRPKCNSSK